MKKHRLLFAVLAIIMALLIIVPMITMVFSAGNARAVTQEDIYALQAKQEELERQKEIIQAQIDANKDKKTDITSQKKLLDEKMANTQSRIDNYDSQITETTAQMVIQQQVYDDAYTREQALLQLFNKQLRASEEMGKVSYLSVLFGAKSFSDLLGMIDFMSQVYSSEQDTVNKLRTAKAEAETARQLLLASKSIAEAAKTEQEKLKTQLSSDIAAANSLIIEYNQLINEDNDTYNELEAEEQAYAEEILRLTKELDAQNGGNQSGSSGYYIWPSDCRYITSPFGNDYLNGSWRKHNGIDIGASYGTSIYAADGGEVVSSTYSSSYGYYVMISHGNGRYTLYAHMSQILVDEGESVYQGQVIGKVGSTGYSTGPHIHFEIIENGSYVDPLDYLTGYIPCW